MSGKQHGSDLPDPEAGKSSNAVDSALGAPTPRHWIWRHKLIVAVGIVLSLGFGHYLVMRSVDNPNPQKKVVVRGSFPYDRGWDLRIDISYYTKNPTCKQTANAFFIFPQAEVARGAWRSAEVTREGDNQYRFEFYEDALSPGFCEWALRFVNYRIYSDGKEIQGGAMLGFPSNFNTIRYTCSGVKMPRTNETKVACFEGNDRRRNELQSDNLIDFIWERNSK